MTKSFACGLITGILLSGAALLIYLTLNLHDKVIWLESYKDASYFYAGRLDGQKFKAETYAKVVSWKANEYYGKRKKEGQNEKRASGQRR